MTPPRVFCHVLLLIFAACGAGLAQVTVTAREDGPARVETTAQNPLVFEVGKLGLPWRTVYDARKNGATVEWTAVNGRVYEVWDRDEYARAQLRAVGELPGRAQEPGRSLTGLVVETMRRVQRRRASIDSDRLAIAEIRLSRALCALLGVRISIEAGANLRVWPECDIPISTALTRRDTQARARFVGFLKPDNWSVESVKLGANASSARGVLRIPGQSAFYPGNYPVTAFYEIEYGRIRFRAAETVEVELIHPFEKEAWIETISGTEIDLGVRLTSLARVRGIRTELYLPDGWTGLVPIEQFDLDGEKTLTYRITKPADDPEGLRIVGAVFRVGDYATSKRLISDHALRLGESTSVTGFRMVRSAEMPKLDTVAGRSCRRIPASGRMGFDISENFLPGAWTSVTVECSSEEECSVAIEYKGADGVTYLTDPQPVGPDGQWQKRVFALRNAVFDGSLADGADFAVVSQRGSPALSSIFISRFGDRP